MAEARSWKEVPWLHQGRTRQGVDCAGLIIVVAKALSLANYDTTDYQRRSHGRAFLQHFKDNMNQKPLLDAQPGDVILFRDRQFPCHCAIVAEANGQLTIIHGHVKSRKVVETRLDEGDWFERRVACFEFEDLEDG